MLYETLKSDRIQAMKDRKAVEKQILGTLVGQIELESSKPSLKVEPKSDLHCVGVIKKFLDDLTFTKEHTTDADDLARNAIEIKTLQSYMPTQLSEKELEAVIITTFGCALTKEKKGQVMGYLKQNHASNYDGKLAASVFDRLAR